MAKVMPRETKRSIWLGLLLAPIAAPVLYFLGALLFVSSPIEGTKDIVIGARFVFAFATPVSYLATLVLGLPFVTLLKAKGYLSFWWCTLGGSLLGALSFIFFWVFLIGTHVFIYFHVQDIVRVIGVGGALGFGVASAFCLVSGVTKSPTGRSCRRAG